MTDRSKVKVIKKGEIKAVEKSTASAAKSKRAAARDMVSNVTNWVSDFQARKRGETRVAIENLFAQQPRPSES